MAVATLAEHVATGDGDAVGGDSGVPDGPGDRLTHVGLDHVHLPRLEEAGVVEHDREAGTVRYRGDERLESVLATGESLDA